MSIEKIYDIFITKCNSKVSTDTRGIKENSLFFALRGEHFNGNSFAEEALKKGAAYVIIDEEKYKKDDRYILVADTQETLAQLAHFHRKQFSLPVIAITGSNGKTTTKELVHAVLKTEKKVVATEGNLNNHIGVPLTLLRISEKTDIAIIEMGANHVGEIDYLCSLANPNYGIITNIGRAHLGNFGGFDGVIRAKTELYRYLEKHKGSIFVNGEDELLLKKANTEEKITYGKENTDYVIKSLETHPFVSCLWKDMKIQSSLSGEYNIMNISVAIVVGDYFGISRENIKKGIETYIPSNTRSEIEETENNNLLIKDFYNANRDSMYLALENLEKIKEKKNKIAILGDMFELGEYAKEEHQKVLEKAINLSLNEIILVGEVFSQLVIPEGENIKAYKTTEEAIFALQKSPPKNSCILLKASNGMHFTKIYEKVNW